MTPGGHTDGWSVARCGPGWHYLSLMVLSIARIGVAHAEYYTSHAAVGAVSYYADGGDHGGVWLSGGGWTMTAGDAITRDTLKAALGCVDPGTGERLGRKYTPGGTYRDVLGVRRLRRSLSAFDVTYSVPKSISAAWAIADEGTRAELKAAYDKSVEAVVDYLQTNAVYSRRGTNGVERVEVPDGAAVARFDHYTSRAGDPQLHSHLLVMNRVLCADGVWRTLDGRGVYRNLQAASMYGAAVLRAEISQRLGWRWDRIGANRHAEIAGVPTDLIEAWSSRRRHVARRAQEKIRRFEKSRGREPTPGERLQLWNAATVQTRQSKDPDLLGDDPHRGWRRDAIDLGYDPAQLTRSYRTATRVAPDLYDRPEVMVGPWDAERVDEERVDHVMAVVEQHSVGITDATLDALVYSAVNASPLMEDPAALEARAAVDALFEHLKDRMAERLILHDGLWYSPGMIAAEVTALSWLAGDATAARTVAAPDLGGLSVDQAEAVGVLVGAAANGIVMVGPAGSGKTTTLARFAQAVGPDHVVAVAPTAVAAAELGASVGVGADTVAKVLIGAGRIPKGAWVVVDEAAQLATREMAALCGRVAAAGGRVVLVGDYAQQGSVGAGGLFAAAAQSDTVPVAALSELWRFSDPAEAAATARLRVGDPAALRYHHARGRVSAVAHPEAAEAVGDWWEQHRNVSTLVSAPSNALVTEINTEIAARRAAARETGVSVAGDGDRTIRIGDVITTRRNNRKLVASDDKWVRNGDRWIVEWAHGPGGLRVRRADGDGRIDLPAGYVNGHVELGYAVTHTRAQSATVDAALTVVGAATRLPEMYVGLTRGRHHNHLVVVTDRPTYDEDSPTEHLAPAEILAAVLKRPNSQRTAIEPHQGTLAPGFAARHLNNIANTSHTAAVPVPDSFDAAQILNQRAAPLGHTATNLVEQRVTTAISQWLGGFGAADTGDAALYDGLTDTEKTEVEARLEAWIGVDEYDDDRWQPPADADDEEYSSLLGGDNDEEHAAWDEIPDASEPADYDADGWDDDPSADYGDELPPGWWDDAPPVGGPDADAEYPDDGGSGHTPYLHNDDPDSYPQGQAVDGGGAVQALFDPADPDGEWLAAEQWRHDLGATYRAYDLASAVVSEAVGAADNTSARFPVAAADNPALIALVRRYYQVLDIDDTDAGEHLAALIAQVADGPLRDLLAGHVDPTLVTDTDRLWAAAVRGDLLARRARKWTPTLDALDNLREPIRSQAARVTAAAGHPYADPTAADGLAAHDRAAWWGQCAEWLDNGAQPVELLTKWTATDTGLADAAAGRGTTQTPPSTTAPTWRTVPDSAPTAVPDADTTDAAARARLAVAHSDLPDVEPPDVPNDRHAAQLRSALRKAAAFYHRQLLTSDEAAEARQYLTDRGIGPDDWATWGIGWAPSGWQAVTNVIRDDRVACDAGLANRSRNGRVFDAMRSRVMFPVRTDQGDVAGFAGRTLDPDEPAKYKNTRTTRMYNKSQLLFGFSHASNAIAATGEAVVVEGYTDVIAAHRNGLTNTVGTGGVAYTAHHAAAVAAAGATEVTIIYDGDTAGRANSRRAAVTSAANGTPAAIVTLPTGMDPAQMDPDELHAAARSPLPLLWSEIATAADRRNLDDHADALEAVQDALATTEGDPILELVAAQQASALLSVPLQTATADTVAHRSHTAGQTATTSDSGRHGDAVAL